MPTLPSPLLDWTPEKARAFTRETLSFRHALHERRMFSDAGLEAVLDAYPREKLGVFTMGEDPVAWRTWRRGDPGELSGKALLDGVKNGRLWLNLRAVDRHLGEYAALSDEIFGDVRRRTGVHTTKRDLGLLISSPNAQVFYHLDVSLVSLWQIRGEKRVWIYPVADPYVGEEDLERIVLRETAEQFTFRPEWDAGAQAFDFRPGQMLTWPQNAPHRIVNGDMLNVSLSIEFMTPAALMRANMIYGNGLIRRWFGARPRFSRPFGPAGLGKAVLARIAKAARLHHPPATTTPIAFRLDVRSPERLEPSAPAVAGPGPTLHDGELSCMTAI